MRLPIGRTWRKRSAKNAQARCLAAGYTGDVPVLRERRDRRQIAVRYSLPGVVVARFTGGGPLVRAIPERYSTALHLAGQSQWTTGRARWSSAPGTISVKVPGEVTTFIRRFVRAAAARGARAPLRSYGCDQPRDR